MERGDRPLTSDELALFPDRVERQGEVFEFEGAPLISTVTFYGGDEREAPEISLRRRQDDRQQEGGGWEIVSSKPMTLGLNVETVGRATRPAPDDDVPDELDAFLPPGAVLDDAVEVAEPLPIRPLRRRSGQLVKPEIIFPPDDRQIYKPSSKAGSAHSLMGKLEVWLDPSAPSPSYAGTGALIAKNAILTAAHVIPWFQVANSLPFKARFIPAYFDGASVFTRADGSHPASWCTGAWGYPGYSEGDDMGVWRLATPLGQEWGYFGYKTYNSDWEDLPVWRINGYPGDLANGQRPARDFNFPITNDEDDGAGVELEYQADTNSGMSGSPVWGWFDKNGVPKPYVVGTHKGSEDNPFEEAHNIAAGGPALSSIIKWARDNW